VALLHLLGEWIYLGRTPRGSGAWITDCIGSGWPARRLLAATKMKELHTTKYLSVSAVTRETADRSLSRLAWLSQGMNLVMLAGLAIYLWRIANPADPARFVSTNTKFPG